MIIPLDGEAIYIRNNDGQTVVKWTNKTKVALDCNYRQLGSVAGGVIRYRVHSSSRQMDIKLPAGQMYATKHVRAADKDLKSALAEKWLSARGVRIWATRQADHLPTKDEPYFAGKWTFAKGRGKGATLTVGDKVFEVSMKKGGRRTCWCSAC